MEKYLMSYPRSGNHLVRFFIELFTEHPTFGCEDNEKDIPLNENIYKEYIPFNIKNDYKNNDCYRKTHSAEKMNREPKEIIFIIRNPKEVILRKTDFNFLDKNMKINEESKEYFKLLEFYENFKGKKHLIIYERLIKDKKKVLDELYSFLNINNPVKYDYVMNNIDKLYNLCLNGEKRSWGKNKSSGEINFYYKKLENDKKKLIFDNFIETETSKFKILKEIYDL